MTICIGMDYGLRRTGLAVGDTDRRLAFAAAVHVEGRDGSLIRAVASLAAERGAERIVLGLPLTADGRETEMAGRVRRLAEVLERDCGLPVVLWDERFTSAEADRWLAGRKRVAKGDRDALAAEIMLQSYLVSVEANGEDA